MKIGWKLEGGDELAAKLRDLPTAVRKKTVQPILKKAGEPIGTLAGIRAPRDPESSGPHLADSIIVRILSDSRTAKSGRDPEHDFAVEIGPTKQTFYGFFQEYGTARHGAQPFMRPAFDSGSSLALGTIGRGLWEAIRKRAEKGL